MRTSPQAVASPFDDTSTAMPEGTKTLLIDRLHAVPYISRRFHPIGYVPAPVKYNVEES
jgi:hypothetical protein